MAKRSAEDYAAMSRAVESGEYEVGHDQDSPPVKKWKPFGDDRQQEIHVQFEPGGTVFTYVWGGEDDLQVGDKVRTPSWLPSTHPNFGQPGVATVCALGSVIEPGLTLYGRFTKGPLAVTVLTERAEA